MNREAGLEYGFSWWRRAAAVAAAGTLSLSLVGCEKPADEQQHVTQPEVVSTEDTSSVDDGLEAEASSKYPNIENTAGFSDDENLVVCFQDKEYALSWGDALISSGWDKVATEVDSTRCEGKGYPRDGWKEKDNGGAHLCIPRQLPEGEIHYYFVDVNPNATGGYNIRATSQGPARKGFGLEESCNLNPGPNDIVPVVK